MRGSVSPPEGYPVRRTFSIWVEGFKNAKDSGTAEFIGNVESSDFHSACVAWATYHPEFAKHYNRQTNSYRGCKLWPSEEAARKAHG